MEKVSPRTAKEGRNAADLKEPREGTERLPDPVGIQTQVNGTPKPLLLANPWDSGASGHRAMVCVAVTRGHFQTTSTDSRQCPSGT